MTKTKLGLSLVAFFILYSSNAVAEEEVTLDKVEIIKTDENVRSKKVGEIKKGTKEITKQQIQSTKDLVKYETGVSVVETGRFGSSGYAIRGVDENRVAILIDGLQQANTLSSQGFKELFEGYGNFNNARNGVEVETLKSATINKGANSVKTGSGSLGGSVIFETKDARDFLIEKDYYYGFKGGFSTENNQKFHSHTLAAKYKMFDILFVHTKRDQHELENYGYDDYDGNVVGRKREKADPYDIARESNLVKIGFQPNEENRLTFAFDGYTNRSKGHDYSYDLVFIQSLNLAKEGQRYTDDESKRKNFSVAYENFTETPLWDSFKVTFSNQKIRNRARTEEYCRGDECKDLENPVGFKKDGANIVDKNGQNVDLFRDSAVGGLLAIQDSSGKKYSSGFDTSTSGIIQNFPLDCSIFDCSKEIVLHKVLGTSNYNISPKTTINLSTPRSTHIINGQEYAFYVTEERTSTGKLYKKVTPKVVNGANENVTTDFYFLKPGSKGYLERVWKERDLDSNTKQFNVDFEKYFMTKDLEHSLSYGVEYKMTEKTMTNKQGYDAANPKWWANTYVTNCSGADAGNALKCPKTEPETSFLIPVKSKEGALYIADEVMVSNQLSINFGYRYDKIKYKPNYIPGVSPKIPDGMVEGLFIPFEKLLPIGEKPNIYSSKYVDPQYLKDLTRFLDDNGFIDKDDAINKGNFNAPSPYSSKYDAKKDPKFIADQAAGLNPRTWDRKYNNMAEVNNALIEYEKIRQERIRAIDINKNNAEKNIEYLSQQKTFENHSFALGVDFDPLDYLRIQTKYSKGFRAPTHEELYLTFKHPDFTIKPNADLKSEIAKTQEIAFTFHKNYSFITLSGFRTDYKNFLDLKYIETKGLAGGGFKGTVASDIYQNINRAKAKVTGFEINSKLHLGDIYDNLSGFYVGYKLTKQKGKILTQEDGYVPMNAIQPTTSVYNLGYIAPGDKFGFDIFIKDVKAKSANDTYNMFWRNEAADPSIIINGEPVTNSSAHWLSNKYTTVDFIGYVKPKESFTVRFGAYNITDKKYRTWESVRSIRPFGTTNKVNKPDSLGINRFNAPGRNFKVDFELTF